MNDQKHSLWRLRVGFVLVPLVHSAGANIITLLAFRFLTDNLAISAAAAGVMFAVMKIYDGIFDPALGLYSDRLESRWGRRLPFILGGAILMPLAIAMVFNTPEFSSVLLAQLFLTVALLLHATAYTALTIPGMAMLVEAADDPHERSTLMAYRVFGNSVGVLFGSTLPAWLLTWWGATRDGHAKMSWVVAGTVLLAGLASVWLLRDAPRTHPPKDDTRISLARIGRQFSLAWANQPFRILATAHIFVIFGTAITTIGSSYFARYVLHRPDSWLGNFYVFSTVGAVALPGWREALVVVPDTGAWIETLTTVGGWEVAWRGRSDTSLNALWGLPAQARTRQTLLRNVGTHSGFMRLVVVSGVPQQRIRAHDQAWETGGISALDLRVVDMDTTRAALEARGWNGSSDPVRYTTYGFDVIQWAPRSPDGVRLSFIQRISPPLQGWSELRHWSRLTNAAIVVQDMAVARAFQEGALGLRASSESNTVGAAGPNVMGLPWALNAAQKVDIHGFSGQPAGDAAIELIAMSESRGRDFSEHARPPNLGIAGLRFVVADLDAVIARLAGAGVTAVAGPVVADLQPFGRCRACAVSGPDGLWLEFFQPAA